MGEEKKMTEEQLHKSSPHLTQKHGSRKTPATSRTRMEVLLLILFLVVSLSAWPGLVSRAYAAGCMECVCANGSRYHFMDWTGANTCSDYGWDVDCSAYRSLCETYCEDSFCGTSTLEYITCRDAADYVTGCSPTTGCTGSVTVYECYASPTPHEVPVPTVTQWGMIIFMAAAGLAAVWFLVRRRRTVA